MRIETEKFILREWRDSDAVALAQIANNKKIYNNLRDLFPYPYSLIDAQKFISNAMQKNDKMILFAVEIKGEIAGSFAVTFKDDIYRKNAEMGYFLGEDYWNKGYTTQILKELVKFIFSTYDIIRIYAEPFSDNLASRRTLEKAGFKFEAILKNNAIKNELIKDSCIYTILREDYNSK